LVQEAKYRWVIPKKISVEMNNVADMFPDKASFSQLIEAAQTPKKHKKLISFKKDASLFSCNHCSFQSSCQFGLNQHVKRSHNNHFLGQRSKSKNRFKEKEISVDLDPCFVGFDDSYVPRYASRDLLQTNSLFGSSKDLNLSANKNPHAIRPQSRSPSPTKVLHKGSKSQSCPHCSYSTLSSHNLSRHVKEDHGTLFPKAEKLPLHVPLNVHSNISTDSSVQVEPKRNMERSTDRIEASRNSYTSFKASNC